jgi:hypothetical protein
VVGVAEVSLRIERQQLTWIAATKASYVGMGYDSVAAFVGNNSWIGGPGSNSYLTAHVVYVQWSVAVGFHYVAALEWSNDASNAFYGDAGGGGIVNSSLIGEVCG